MPELSKAHVKRKRGEGNPAKLTSAWLCSLSDLVFVIIDFSRCLNAEAVVRPLVVVKVKVTVQPLHQFLDAFIVL